MPAGATVYWLGGTLHAAGANTSDRWREGLFISCGVGWITSENNVYLEVPLEVVKELDPQARAILGAYDYRWSGAPKPKHFRRPKAKL